MAYDTLDPALVIQTLERLERRIGERFPGFGLCRVAHELVAIARKTERRIEDLKRPWLRVRIAVLSSVAVLATMVGVAIVGLAGLEWSGDLGASIQAIESGIQEIILLGIAVLFLLTIEPRLKRRATLRALHELRSLAHIVDMHQLTKDPNQFDGELGPTTSSPERTLTPAELHRYLDYCSELLSLTSKLGALYAQQLDDPVVLDTVNGIQNLTTALSNKIWQKIGLLTRARPALG
jgi:hypothetical protein